MAAPPVGEAATTGATAAHASSTPAARVEMTPGRTDTRSSLPERRESALSDPGFALPRAASRWGGDPRGSADEERPQSFVRVAALRAALCRRTPRGAEPAST